MWWRGVEVEGRNKTLGKALNKSPSGGGEIITVEENRGKTRGKWGENKKVLKANQELL